MKQILSVLNKIKFDLRLILRCSLFFLNLSTAIAYAQPQPVSPQRQALVKVAYDGLYYFLYQAFQDSAFVEKLNLQERQMIAGLETVLEQAHALRWFKENKISYYEKSSSPKVYTYAYVDLTNEVVQMDTLDLQAPSLVFSNDRERFQNLKPGEPERTAKTFPAFSKAIEINLFRLNDPNIRFDIGDAVSLLIHEYGHKLDHLKIQSAVDSLAVKLGDFIRSRLSTTEVSPGLKVYSLIFKNFKYESWLDFGLFRGIVDFKTGLPRLNGPYLPQNRLPVFDGQGFYLWSDFNGECTDLTKDFLKKVVKKNLIRRDYPDEKYYHFVDQNLIAVESFEVKADPVYPQQIQLKFNLAQLATQQGYMIPTVSPSPAQAEFAKRYYYSQTPYFIEPISGDLNVTQNGPLFDFKGLKESYRSVFFTADGEVKLQSSRLEKNKLIFNMQIQSKLKAQDIFFSQLINVDKCEIEIKAGDVAFLIDSKKYDPVNHIFTFEIDQIDRVNLSELTVSRVYLKKNTQNISDNSFQAKVEIGVYDAIKIPLQASKPTGPTQSAESIKFVAVQQLPGASKKIRLTLSGTEKIKNLRLVMKTKEVHFSFMRVSDKNESILRKTTGNIVAPQKMTEIRLDSSQFKQELTNGLIVIEFDLSEISKFSTVENLENHINQHGVKISVFKMVMVLPTVYLDRVEVLSDSLKLASFEANTPTSFEVQVFKNQPYGLQDQYMQLFKAKLHENIMTMSCRQLFN